VNRHKVADQCIGRLVELCIRTVWPRRVQPIGGSAV
jgi:hypothetical protein